MGSWDLLAEQPGSEIGRYRLLSVLGEGGMGVVYLAEQDHPIRRQVALKVVKPGMDSGRVLARFEAEQQALALMEHPHIARVYDAGLAPGGRPYFVMEHVKGLPITEHCDQHRLTIEQRLHLFLDVCEAVQHAHQKGIIHRDLKPSNILVAIEGDRAIPKVIDFGVARAISQPLSERTLYTEQGQLIGTPEYMSPEQADLTRPDIDTRTDVYALGIVLYQLLSGVLPFDSKSFRAGGIEHIRKVICEEEPKTPSVRLSKTTAEESTESARRRHTDLRTLRRKLRGDLDWITLKALEKDRTRRYGTVDALAADIRHCLSHEPVSAAPPSVLYRTRKSLRRHRAAVSAAGTALFVLIVTGWAIHVYLQAGRLEHEQMLAQAKELVAEGQFSEASATVAPLLSSIHVGRPAQLLRAKILLSQENLEAAVIELEKLVDTPDEVAGQAHLLLASIYYEGDPRAPGPTDQYYQRYEHHRREAEKLIAGTADYYFLEAQGTYDIQEMLHLLNKALELDPRHYDSLHQRACIYFAQKDYIKLLMSADAMTTARPNSPQGYNLRAIALREMPQPQYDDAILEHDQAIRRSPQQARFYDERGRTYQRLHQYERALEDANTCVALEPDNSSYVHRLFGAYTAVGQYGRAEQLYQSLPRWMAGYQFTGIEPTGLFFALTLKLVLDSRGASCSWHSVRAPLRREPFSFMYLANEYYDQLKSEAQRLIPHGFHPSWSPDGTQLVYTQGISLGSVLAKLDVQTGHTELLVAPGRDPEWSLDGKHIAFVKAQRLLPLRRLGALTVRDMLTIRGAPQQPPEIWVMDWDTRRVWRIAEGQNPHWGRKSGRLYYSKDRTLYAVSPGQGSAATPVRSGFSDNNATVSPDEQYVADVRYPELRITERETGNPVASWIIPPPISFLWVTSLHWSPDSRTVSVGNRMISETGLWVYDLHTRTALNTVDIPVAATPRSPDGKRLALSVSQPLYEIWIADVDPNRPTAQVLGVTRTVEEHCREVMKSCDGRLARDPNSLENHLHRTAAALWIGDDRAKACLLEMDQALIRVSYPDGECALRARVLLSGLSPTHGRLLPLAERLACEAVRQQPGQARLFAWMFRRAGYPEKAFDLLEKYPDAPWGSNRYNRAADTYTLTGIGADIWDGMDDFHFAYKTLDRDGSITARIDSVQNVHEWTKAGVMIRSTLEPNCPNAMVLVTPSGRVSFQYRFRSAQATDAICTPLGSIQLPHWVRLTRRGNQFAAQHSSDGVFWLDVVDSSDQRATAEIPMDEAIHIGLVVTAHDITKTAEARFSRVGTTGKVSPSGPFTISQDVPSPFPSGLEERENTN